jgi:Protein of unknown function (DUF3179)
VCAVVAVQIGMFVWVVHREREARRRNQALTVASLDPAFALIKVDSSPIVRPLAVPAREASLRPDELVVGVEVGGQTRAYRLASMEDPSSHLVNDLVGRVPISIAYCDLTRCVRVYTDAQATTPLDARVAGLLHGEMVVEVRGSLYFQKSGAPVETAKNPPALPYALLSPVVTTWSDWVHKHPLTEVYVGVAAAPRPGSRPWTAVSKHN